MKNVILIRTMTTKVSFEAMSEDIPTLFQVIFRQGPECVRPFLVDPLTL